MYLLPVYLSHSFFVEYTLLVDYKSHKKVYLLFII